MNSGPNWRKWQVVAGAAALVAGGVFVGRRLGPSARETVDAGDHVERGTVATPDDLLADLVLLSPNASWTRLQRGVGGAMGILPATLPGVVLALTDLDGELANELDGTAPMYGAVAGDPADPAVLVAIRLVDSRRARGLLVDGDTARFGAKDVAGMTLLVSGRPSRAPKLELALTPNGYLVVTRRVADLERLAPYVTRTLPERRLATKAAGIVEIPRSALANTLAPRAAALWADAKAFLLREDERMRTERGRAPDFGDPAAIVSAIDGVVRRRIDVFGDLEKLQLGFDVADDAIVLDATLVPTKRQGPADRWLEEMKVGDPSAVLTLPSISTLAVSARDGEEAREEQAKDLEKGLTTALGSRLKDPSKLHEVITTLTKARDESVAFAFWLDERSGGGFVRAPVRDSAAVEKGIRGGVDLLKADPFYEILRVRQISQATNEEPGLGRVSTVTLVRDPKPTTKGKPDAGVAANGADRSASTAGLAWFVQQNVFVGAVGSPPLYTLAEGWEPNRRLGEQPSLTRFVAAIGNDATTIVVAQPLRLDPKRANLPMAPLAFATGKKNGDGFVHVDVSDALLREFARWQMGF